MKLELCSPEKVGVSTESILNFIKAAEAIGVEMHSLMLLRHGKVFAKAWWDPYKPEVPHALFSFTKTLTATAIGFAEQEGALKLTDKLCDIFPDFLPENPSENLLKADIYSLLTMSCGHETEVGTENWEKEFLEDGSEHQWERAFFAHEFKYAPGTMFQYNTVGTNMLCAVLKRKTGEDLTEYLRPRLLEPLEMEFVCRKMPDGVEMGGAGGLLRTEDMAKFIQFFLQRGVWEGKRLLNESWFDRATVKQIETVNPVFTNHDSNWRLGYGFQMWRCIPDDLYRADGAFGQFGVVVPDKDAVIIVTSASTYPDDLLNLMWKHLLLGMKDGELPADPAAQQKLEHCLSEAKLPTLWGVRDRACEKALEGVRFVPKEIKLLGLTALIGGFGAQTDSSGSIAEMTLAFDEGEALLAVRQQDGKTEKLPIALDNRWAACTLRGKPYAATGRWRGQNHFEFEARCTEAASGTRFLLNFAPDELEMDVDYTLPTPGLLNANSGVSHVVFERI